MQRSLSGDIEIGFKRMTGDWMDQRIGRRNAIPIQENPRLLHLFYLYEQRVSREAVANPCVKKRDDGKSDRKYPCEKPSSPAAHKIAESESKQHAHDEDYSTRVPILMADGFKRLRPATQPRDLFVELL
jgi:hypothetical protein